MRRVAGVPAEAALRVLRSRPHGHVAAVLGTIKALGLPRLLGAQPIPRRERCLAMVASRVLSPASKLATARTRDADSATSILGEELGVEAVQAEDRYEPAMVGDPTPLSRKELRSHSGAGAT